MKMDVVLLAGGLMSDDDPLINESQDRRRCLIKIHGKSMAQWVIDALTASKSVGALYVIGLPEEVGLTSSKPISYLSDKGGLIDNIRSGVLQATENNTAQSKVLLASADIPAIRPEMVDWLVDQVAENPGAQIYYNVISQEVMEVRYPGAKRSFVRFKDIAVCGGDLNVIDRELFSVERPIWKKLSEARKNPLKQVRLLGISNLFLVVFHLVTFQKAVERVCEKLSIKGRALLNPYAEMAMDADKPHQLAILRRDLEVRL